MSGPINGVIPVMLTPFTADDRVDFDGLGNLIEWYLAKGADALFAVCLSSEMFHLSRDERRAIGRFVVDRVRGRVPVLVSGHVSESPDEQAADLHAATDSGADAVVLITNRLGTDPADFRPRLDALMRAVPADMGLGLYECPQPQRRLLSDDELQYCAATGRFRVLKDVSCDLDVIRRRLDLLAGSGLAICNANAAIAFDAITSGARGFCGIFSNFAPDLYQWLLDHGEQQPELAARIAPMLSLGSLCERFGYPALAKRYHRRLGTFASEKARAPGPDFDLDNVCWAADAVLESLDAAIQMARADITASRRP
ncbi:MAG TPA: dihydrodipicolinate synthase family protein [Asticcacaulis sp.]|nr:dihydrodipicolinate synthase family protein [Asticcacaulis sp.]